MAAGIPTVNVLQPGAVSIPGGANRALVSFLQLLKPQYWNKYIEVYGIEDFSGWLQTYSGMEQVYNQNYFWFENRGKLMQSIISVNVVTNPAAGANVTITLDAGDHFNNGTESPLRVNESVRVASSLIEGTIIAVNKNTPFAHTATIAPKQTGQAFVSANSTSLAAGEVLIFAGYVDVGEASGPIDPLIHLDVQFNNNITEVRDDWEATDLAEMTSVYYDTGVSGDATVSQAGTSLFTFKGMVKTEQRLINNKEAKLMYGNFQNNTAISNSVGCTGLIPWLSTNAPTVGWGPTIDFAKMHEITRVMDVNGTPNQVCWLQDIFLNQSFSDGIFKELPAGAFVWGQGAASEEASLAYGFQKLYFDQYMFQTKKYKQFAPEYTTGHTPNVAYTRRYGIICPMGQTSDARNSARKYNNLTVMYQQPPAGGTFGNGFRVWTSGGGSRNPTDGNMVDQVHFICYPSLRTAGARQFIETVGN